MSLKDVLLLKWLEFIPNKLLLWEEISDELSLIYSQKTDLNYIISFDIEFFHYKINKRQIQTIREMGGLILYKLNKKWYLVAIFHLNLATSTNINNLYLLSSKYATLSDDTLKKVQDLEKQLLPHYDLTTQKTLTDDEFISFIKKNKLYSLYLHDKKINKLIEIKKINYDKFMKELGRIIHLIYGYDLVKYKYEHTLFFQIQNLVLNDPDNLARTLPKSKEKHFIDLTNILFGKSFLIIKGMEDIKALKNQSMLNKLNTDTHFKYFDIATYNSILFSKCNSAELEKTYTCLTDLNYTQMYHKFSNIINKFSKMKAHNPLVDAYYTWIIYNIFLLNNINEL